jgi:SAM-dependent methyltransferase
MAAADNYADWTFSLFEPLVRGQVLEVGCGVGTFTKRLLAAHDLRGLLSIDASAAAVAHCREQFGHHRAIEIKHLPVEHVDGRFDLVVCMNVLEHIEDHRAALRHMLDLLSAQGTLFLLVPAHQMLFSSFDVLSGHHRRYTKRSMRALVNEVAYRDELTLRQFYFNTIGALGYWGVYKLLRKAPEADAAGEIGWFDRAIVPVQRRLEGRMMPFGLSLVSVMTKGRVR